MNVCLQDILLFLNIIIQNLMVFRMYIYAQYTPPPRATRLSSWICTWIVVIVFGPTFGLNYYVKYNGQLIFSHELQPNKTLNALFNFENHFTNRFSYPKKNIANIESVESNLFAPLDWFVIFMQNTNTCVSCRYFHST